MARAESPKSDALKPGPGSLMPQTALAAFHTTARVSWAKGTQGDTPSVLLGSSPIIPSDRVLCPSALCLLSNALQPKEQANILTDVDCLLPQSPYRKSSLEG